MPNKAATEDKRWEQNRSRLFDYADANKSKDSLSRYIYNLMAKSPAPNTKYRTAKESVDPKRAHPNTIGAEVLGLSDRDVASLLNAFPGNRIASLTYSGDQAPARLAPSSGKCSYVLINKNSDNLAEVNIFDPLHTYESGCDIFCHGCLQAHTAACYPGSLAPATVDSIHRALKRIASHEFHATHHDRVTKPGRSRLLANQEELAVLWPSLVQSAYEAPFRDAGEDWLVAVKDALKGMQYLGDSEAEAILQALSDYFADLDPGADMNSLIREYQHQVKVIEFKILSRHIADLFQEMHDKGLKAFFNRWVHDIDPDSIKAPGASLPLKHHVPGLRIGMAMDDAKELGVNLAASLRIPGVNTKDKRKALHDLRLSIRRFNDIWKDLDKNEQKYLRPKLLQIVHSSIN